MASQNQVSRWLFGGICSISLMMGHLTGASSTPIVGAVITSVLGGVAAVWAARTTEKAKTENPAGIISLPEQSAFDSKLLGIAMTLVAVFFTLGTFLGATIRIKWSSIIGEPEIIVPWATTDETCWPADPNEVWKWMKFSEDAVAMGLSAKEIQAVYQRYAALPTATQAGIKDNGTYSASVKRDTATAAGKKEYPRYLTELLPIKPIFENSLPANQGASNKYGDIKRCK